MSVARRKILIVEDEPAIRNTLYTLLAGLGCDGDMAYDGRQALAMVSREQFDAVLLDLRCPLLSVEEVVAQIHEIRPSLVGRVLVITGEVADEKTLDLIEQHFLLQVPRSRLTQELGSLLRALLVLAPTPDHAG